MGFLDFAGEMMGRAVANGQEMMKYKTEYEKMSNQELKREYNYLKNKPTEFLNPNANKECQLRLNAIRSILVDRA